MRKQASISSFEKVMSKSENGNGLLGYFLIGVHVRFSLAEPNAHLLDLFFFSFGAVGPGFILKSEVLEDGGARTGASR